MTREKKAGDGPLSNLRVLEFGQIAAGPFAGSLLADLGADVVKVENPVGGDGMRGWPPLSRGADDASFSENFASVNRNKRSITADLKDAESCSRLKELIAAADVLVENFRTGTLQRLGLGYEDVKVLNPRTRVLLDYRLWPIRSQRPARGFRRHGPGHERPDERDRRGRAAAGEVRGAGR